MAQGKVLDRNGVKSVIQIILDKREIRPDQRWRDSTGSPVIVTETQWIDGDLFVYYKSEGSGSPIIHDRDSFSFQCRYCLDPNSPSISAELRKQIVGMPIVKSLPSSSGITESGV